MPFTNQTEEKQIERAVLVGLSCPSFNTDQDADERTMDELRALAETAGAEAVAMTLQRRISACAGNRISVGVKNRFRFIPGSTSLLCRRRAASYRDTALPVRHPFRV